MKMFKQVKKYGVGVVLSAALSSSAFAADASGVDAIWGAIDLSGIGTKVAAAGVLVIGVCMVFKSIRLGKKTVNTI